MKQHKQRLSRFGSSIWQILLIGALAICLVVLLFLLSGPEGGVKAAHMIDVPIRSAHKASYRVDAIRKFLPPLKIDLIRQVITTKQGSSFIIESEFKHIVGNLDAAVPSVTSLAVARVGTEQPALMNSAVPSATASLTRTSTQTPTMTASPTETRPALLLLPSATATQNQPGVEKTKKPKDTPPPAPTGTPPAAPTDTPPPVPTNTPPASTPALKTLAPTSTATQEPHTKPTKKPTKTPKVKDNGPLALEGQLFELLRFMPAPYLKVLITTE